MINRHTLTLALDRHGDNALALAVGTLFLLFSSFLLVLAGATAALATQTGTQCGGTDLLADYARDKPEKLAAMRAEAAETLNGKGVFWRIGKPGRKPSYLLGTMHMADPRIARLAGERAEALREADKVVIENIEALDKGEAASALLRHQDLTLLTDGTTLEDRLDAATLANLREAAKARGMPFGVTKIMRPWLVATSIALPVCEMVEKRAGKPVLDGLIAERAKAAGKPLIGLETIEEQFSAMADLPETYHLAALKETLAMGDRAEDVMETMKQLYLAGDTGMIVPLTKSFSPETSAEGGYRRFEQSLIIRRNRLMAERALPHLEEGGVFIAVGALHLPGKTGLVEQFRAAGFRLTRAD